MNTNHINRRDERATADVRETNTRAINAICAVILSVPGSDRSALMSGGDTTETAAAFLLSGLGSLTGGRKQFAHELDRHLAMVAHTFEDIALWLLLPPRFDVAIDGLETELGEAFRSYLSFSDDGVRERLADDYIVIETNRRIFVFHRIPQHD